jgi:flagellar basal-body rod modification protein FlgD
MHRGWIFGFSYFVSGGTMSASAFTAISPLSATGLLNQNSSAVRANATTAKSTSTSGLDGTTTGTTFLNLLVKELQNQDPTSPMDSTAMVGQMISLNQLDQLISINQVLGDATGSTSSTTSNAVSAGSSATGSNASSAVMAARAALLNASSPSTSVNAAALAASDPSTTLDFSTLNTSFGGK